MNDYEKTKLREHWQKPGKLKALLNILPMVPYDNSTENNLALKRAIWMTGIGYAATETAQLYYMLEEDGVLVREGPTPEPAKYLTCAHSGRNTCLNCHWEIEQRGLNAAVRYRLAKPLAEY